MFRYWLNAIYAIALAMWPIATLAAGVTLSKSFAGIGKGDWMLVVLLSAFSGLVSFLQLLRAGMAKVETDELPPIDGMEARSLPWWFFVILHMLTAILAGLCAFFACEAFEVEDMREALIIAMGAWSGAKLLDLVSAGVSGAVQGFLIGAVTKPKP